MTDLMLSADNVDEFVETANAILTGPVELVEFVKFANGSVDARGEIFQGQTRVRIVGDKLYIHHLSMYPIDIGSDFAAIVGNDSLVVRVVSGAGHEFVRVFRKV